MTILPLLLSLTGLLAGIALSFIAPEELKPGWKYFRMAKLGLFIVLAGLISYSFWSGQNLVGLVVFGFISIIILILNFKLKYAWMEIINYLIFIIPYFFQSGPYQIIIASLLFLYGLPAGTRLWNMQYETKT